MSSWLPALGSSLPSISRAGRKPSFTCTWEPSRWNSAAATKPLSRKMTRIPLRGRFPTSSAFARAHPPLTSSPWHARSRICRGHASARVRNIPPFQLFLYTRTSAKPRRRCRILRRGEQMRKRAHPQNGKLCEFLALLLALFFFFGLAAARSQTAAQDSAAKDPAVQRGRQQFAESCGFCHGPDATGARGPDLVRSPLVAHDVKGDKIGEVIRFGRPDKGMPPMPMTDEQVADIAAFLHARATEALESGSVPKSYPVEKLLTGNPEMGKAYFNGPGGCKNCHSPTGDLAAVATKFSTIELETRMLYPGGRGGRPIVTAVVTLPSGERIQGPLVHADDFVVGLRDASG